MGSSFTPQLKKILLASGCRFERQGKGDHEIWFSPLTQRRFVVDSEIKSRHTANAMEGLFPRPKAAEPLATFRRLRLEYGFPRELAGRVLALCPVTAPWSPP